MLVVSDLTTEKGVMVGAFFYFPCLKCHPPATSRLEAVSLLCPLSGWGGASVPTPGSSARTCCSFLRDCLSQDLFPGIVLVAICLLLKSGKTFVLYCDCLALEKGRVLKRILTEICFGGLRK